MGTHADNLEVIRAGQPDAVFALDAIEGLLKLLEDNAEAQIIKEVWEHDAEQWANTIRVAVGDTIEIANKRFIYEIFVGRNLSFLP